MNSVYFVRKCPRYKFIVLSHLSRLVHDYSNIMKIIFTVAFSWSIVAFSAIMLLLRIMVKCFESNQRSNRIFLITFLLIFFLRQGTSNLLAALYFSLQVFGLSVGIFEICEFGERLSESYGEISDAYDQLNWHLFPRKAQHMLITQLIMAQRPVQLRVFGSICCGRITMKDVGTTFELRPKEMARIHLQ